MVSSREINVLIVHEKRERKLEKKRVWKKKFEHKRIN